MIFILSFKKIYALTYLSSEKKTEPRIENENVVYETYLKDSLFFTGDTEDYLVGNGTLYRVDRNVKCSGKFDLNQFVQGTVYGYYDSTKKCYEYTYDSSLGNRYYSKGSLYELTNDGSIKYFYNGDFQDGKIINGITTLFEFDEYVSYKGEIKDGQIEGQGTSYIGVGSPEFEGTWKNGFIINGIKFVSRDKVFEGEFKYGKIPWNGKAYNYDLSHTVKKFTGDIQDGKPVHACLFATFSLYWTVTPIFLRSEPLHYSNNEIALFGFVAITGAFLTPTIGKLADKGYIFIMTNVSMVLVTISIVLLFFVHDHSYFSVIFILISGICIDIGVAGNLLLGQKVIFGLNPEIRNRLNGLYMTIFFLGGAFGSWIGSYAYYSFNSKIALLIGAAFPLIALFVHILKNNTMLVASNKNKHIS
ncbi:MFS transporter [Bacillus paramycoides]|uniref:MFS transporter n=1 Tax=Bacillus paramycoides TaxID=2026194 RepID=UPI002E1D1724|nr:MFS transporter [Bacillus paramycoides]